jgi:hypothetical protein
MRRLLVLLGLAALGGGGFACGEERPPILDPRDDGGGKPPPVEAGPSDPCSPPQTGCPCTNPGEQLYCGIIYRESNGVVDCAKGYRTCQADGGWGPCEGPRIFGAD